MNYGRTPLHAAAYCGHVEVVQLLLNAGADVNKASPSDGETPLYMAAFKGHTEVVKLLLLDKNADINKADKIGCTPLYIAACKGYTEVVQMLLAKNAEVDKATLDARMTPLHVAAYNGHAGVTELLLAKNADFDKADRNSGQTPLFHAAHNGNAKVVQLLLDAGADVHKARTLDGQTPLSIAVRCRHIRILKLLLNAGANPDPIHGNIDVLLSCMDPSVLVNISSAYRRFAPGSDGLQEMQLALKGVVIQVSATYDAVKRWTVKKNRGVLGVLPVSCVDKILSFCFGAPPSEFFQAADTSDQATPHVASAENSGYNYNGSVRKKRRVSQ